MVGLGPCDPDLGSRVAVVSGELSHSLQRWAPGRWGLCLSFAWPVWLLDNHSAWTNSLCPIQICEDGASSGGPRPPLFVFLHFWFCLYLFAHPCLLLDRAGEEVRMWVCLGQYRSERGNGSGREGVELCVLCIRCPSVLRRWGELGSTMDSWRNLFFKLTWENFRACNMRSLTMLC